MIFSSPTEYALRGLSEMAIRGGDQRIVLDELVAGTNLPRDFMAKVFQRLVHAGLLRSSKGRGGGFSLARPDHQITMMQIVEAIDGPQMMDRGVVGMEKCDHMACPQYDFYQPIRQRLKDYLNTTTLADLGASLKGKYAYRQHAEQMPAPVWQPG